MKADPRRVWLFTVATRIGKTVDELEQTLTSAELTEWIAFLQLEQGHEILAGRPATHPGK